METDEPSEVEVICYNSIKIRESERASGSPTVTNMIENISIMLGLNVFPVQSSAEVIILDMMINSTVHGYILCIYTLSWATILLKQQKLEALVVTLLATFGFYLTETWPPANFPSQFL